MSGKDHKKRIQMTRAGGNRFLTQLVWIALLVFIVYGCGNSLDGTIVAVEIPEGSQDPEAGARLIALNADAPDKDPIFLTEDFAAAASPALSYDARYLYFQGKKDLTSPWQVWVMDLKKRSVSQVTNVPENCSDPVSLPDGTVIFSRDREIAGTKVQDLWRCGRDGCCLTRITYNPARNVDAHILPEGRILYLSSEQYPEPRDPELMVIRPDGTKSELYSEGCCGWQPVSSGTESGEGYVYFISTGGRLSRVSHRRPLHTFENLSEGISGTFDAVYPLPDGQCLVAFKPQSEGHFGIYAFDPDTDNAPVPLYLGERNLTDPVPVTAMEVRPRKLPSAINPDNPTGLLMSQNVNNSILPVNNGLSGDTITSAIQVSYLEGGKKRIEVEGDGSFYLKLDVDKPFRIRTLNSLGETLRGPSDWIYLRPNERRACTGCHADLELAPENVQPMAVKKDPVEFYATMKERGN
ncbi:MAG: HzsA-related protein [Bacteroidales bacterium]